MLHKREFAFAAKCQPGVRERGKRRRVKCTLIKHPRESAPGSRASHSLCFASPDDGDGRNDDGVKSACTCTRGSKLRLKQYPFCVAICVCVCMHVESKTRGRHQEEFDARKDRDFLVKKVVQDLVSAEF